MAIFCLISYFETNREIPRDVIPVNQKVEFIFDSQSEKTVVLQMWDQFVEAMPESLRSNIGSSPRFESDDEFLPLQAADLFAWWQRKLIEDGETGDVRRFNFGGQWQGDESKAISSLNIELTEDSIAGNFYQMFQRKMLGVAIYGSKNARPFF